MDPLFNGVRDLRPGFASRDSLRPDPGALQSQATDLDPDLRIDQRRLLVNLARVGPCSRITRRHQLIPNPDRKAVWATMRIDAIRPHLQSQQVIASLSHLLSLTLDPHRPVGRVASIFSRLRPDPEPDHTVDRRISRIVEINLWIAPGLGL